MAPSSELAIVQLLEHILNLFHPNTDPGRKNSVVLHRRQTLTNSTPSSPVSARTHHELEAEVAPRRGSRSQAQIQSAMRRISIFRPLDSVKIHSGRFSSMFGPEGLSQAWDSGAVDDTGMNMELDLETMPLSVGAVTPAGADTASSVYSTDLPAVERRDASQHRDVRRVSPPPPSLRRPISLVSSLSRGIDPFTTLSHIPETRNISSPAPEVIIPKGEKDASSSPKDNWPPAFTEEQMLRISGVVGGEGDDGIQYVGWNGESDPENPRNWDAGKKAWVTFVVSFHTFVVYCASAIITPSVVGVIIRYQVTYQKAMLLLAMYVFGCPLIFSPLSEIPAVGRNLPYLSTYIIFCGLSVAVALTDHFWAIVAIRFLQGFFGSPALATGAASLEDIFDELHVPFAFIFWVGGMYCGPALGPAISGHLVGKDWRWPLWEVVIMAALGFPLLAFLPETSARNILFRRARRLRRELNLPHLRVRGDENPIALSDLLKSALAKPIEITIKDPAVAFTALYSCIIYAIYYSFFEVFPFVYMGMHQLSIGTTGLIFLSIIIGVVLAAPIYALYLKYVFLPRAETATFESRLFLGLFASVGVPASLFIFAVTARPEISWLCPSAGITLFAASSFVVFQCLICYIPLSYPRYVASLMAANDFFRSTAAGAMVIVSREMYEGMGVRQGMYLLAGLSTLGVFGMTILYFFGAKMRARSRFAEG